MALFAALLWLLITGEIPTKEEAAAVTQELHARSELPKYVVPMIKSFPTDMHPMTQLSSAVLAMQPSSKFAKAYQSGVNKSKYWESTLEDVLDLMARLPTVAALIYRHQYSGRPASELATAAPYDSSLDWSANFNRMMGFDSPSFDEAMRLYLTIHADHEGGNVSAHTTRLVGSALSDPYLSFSAAMCGLAGPLHGLANQEVLGWILSLQQEFKAANKPVTHETITHYAWDTLNAGKVSKVVWGKWEGELVAHVVRLTPFHSSLAIVLLRCNAGDPRLWPRGAAQDRPPIHGGARVLPEAPTAGRAV